jgi:hypothetical protein
MKRASRAVFRAAAVPALLAGFAAHALTGAVLVVLILVAAVCWTITDPERSQRLATLIKAFRGRSQ